MKDAKDFINSKIRFVFTDIDDTLTDSGLLTPAAYSSLWDLYQRDIHVIPVTGRPAGWCELIARLWPVAGIIGENGGFYFRYVDKTMKRHFVNNASSRADNKLRLETIRAEILSTIPGAAVASDQFCRMMDLAIDFCEDVPRLPQTEVEKIVGVFKKYGAQAKVSSIHVNGWFGDYDKLSMCRTFCEREFNINIDDINNQCVFVGDSPNDEPMFEFFNNSFGVANVKEFLTQIKHPPKYVASLPGGKGFAEITQRILAQK